MHKYLKSINLIFIALAAALGVQATQSKADVSSIHLPKGFTIKVFADEKTKHGELLENARFMAFDKNGDMYVSIAKAGKIVKVIDINHDGIADDVQTVVKNLNLPQGMVFLDDVLLLANQDGVVKVEGLFAAPSRKQVVKVTPFISNLAVGWHTLKTIKLSPDGYLYINIGSSCNVCVEADATRATILRYTLDGKPAGALLTLGRHQQSAIWAHGLRNSQGFAWHPTSGEMFATNNGSDMRSEAKGGKINDGLPPEHLNKIEAGKHYGWPYCWGNQVQDPNFVGEKEFCKTTQAPAITFISHATPIGITFLGESMFPEVYKNGAIVALHGSWNREQKSGYKLVHVKFDAKAKPTEVEDFATGWLEGNQAWGRPVDAVVGTDGALYVSDDSAHAIYRITYQ